MCVVHKVIYIDIELCMLRCPFSGSNIQALFFSLKAVIEIKKLLALRDSCTCLWFRDFWDHSLKRRRKENARRGSTFANNLFLMSYDLSMSLYSGLTLALRCWSTWVLLDLWSRAVEASTLWCRVVTFPCSHLDHAGMPTFRPRWPSAPATVYWKHRGSYRSYQYRNLIDPPNFKGC